MRNGHFGVRYPAPHVRVQQRFGRDAARYRLHLRGGEVTGLDMTVDVKTAKISGTIRIVSPPGRSNTADCKTLESKLTMVDLASASIARTLPKPFRVEMKTQEGLMNFTSVRARQTISGAWEIVKYRERAQDFEEEEACRETLVWRLAAAALGARHVNETAEMLGSDVFLQNVGMLTPYRTIVPTLPQRSKVARILSEGTVVTVGELASALHPIKVNGVTLVYALMLRKYVSIDLQQPMGPDSIVRAFPAAHAVMTGLFEGLHMVRASG